MCRISGYSENYYGYNYAFITAQLDLYNVFLYSLVADVFLVYKV